MLVPGWVTISVFDTEYYLGKTPVFEDINIFLADFEIYRDIFRSLMLYDNNIEPYQSN